MVRPVRAQGHKHLTIGRTCRLPGAVNLCRVQTRVVRDSFLEGTNSSHAPDHNWLFRIQGVEVAVLTRASASARRSSDRGRGLPMMGVPTPPTGKTSTCLTLPSLALT